MRVWGESLSENTHRRNRSSGRTKVDDIKHFCTLVLRRAREQLPIRTGRDTDDGHHVRAVVLDKLDARFLFLPQFEMAIDGRRDDEVRAALRPNGGVSGGGGMSLYTRRDRAENRRTV